METLFINRVFYPNKQATARILKDLKSELEKNNRKVDVLYNNKNNRFLSLIDFFLKSIKISAKDYDNIVIMTDPPFLLLLAPLFKLKRIKVIHWCQDLYPDLFSIMNKKWLNSSITKHLYKCLLKRTDKIIVVGRDMKNIFINNYNISEDKISTICNWSDKSVKPLKIKKDKFIIMYSGNCGKVYNFDIMLDVAEKLKKHKDILFKIITEGSEKEKLLEKIKIRKIDNTKVINYVTEKNYIKSLNSAALFFIPVKQEVKGLMVPCKVYSALKAEIPCIYSGDKHSEISLLIKNYNCGLSSNNALEIKNYILDIYNKTKKVDKTSFKVNIDYNFEKSCKEFKEVIDAL